MSDNFIYSVGIHNVGSYQVSGQPFLSSSITVPANSAVNPIGGKLVLQASDVLRCWASADGDLELTLGVLQIT